jgi:hypothetical protein
MRFSKWLIPLLLRLSGLTFAGDATRINFGLSISAPTLPATSQPCGPTTIPTDLSLELDFYVQVANHEFKVPIMPL